MGWSSAPDDFMIILTPIPAARSVNVRFAVGRERKNNRCSCLTASPTLLFGAKELFDFRT